MSIRAILFDLDGVLRHFDRDREASIEARYQLPAGILRTTLFEKIKLHQAVTGIVSDDAWRADASASLVQMFGRQAGEAFEEWGNDRGQVNPAALAVVQRLRRARPVGLLTNATSRLTADLRLLELADAFDVIVNSSEVGCCKPDRRIFEIATERLSASPSEVLFIDDTPAHVEAAQSLGMKAILFTSVPQLQSELALVELLNNLD